MVVVAVTEPVAIELRHPTESDHRRLVAVIDEWWGGRRMRGQLPRLWLRHFGATSWLAEVADDAGRTMSVARGAANGADGGARARLEPGRLAGFLVGYVGADDPAVASIHLLAIDPNLRRRGIASTLVERFCADVADRGARRVECLVRPDERPAVDFARAVGFEPEVRDRGSWIGARPLYGVPAFEDWDGPGEDRALLVRELASRV